MQILPVKQGSDRWLQARVKYNVASEAAAMLGLDARLPREQYIRMKATGDVRAFTEWEQKYLLDKGKAIEPAARAWAESDTGVEFWPVTGTKGRLLASFDGIDSDDSGKIGLEIKLWNQALVDCIREHDDVPDTHWPQLEHQIFVGDLDWVQFVVWLDDHEHLLLQYRSHSDRRARLLDGWMKVSEEVANFVHVDKPAPVVGINLPSVATPEVIVVGEVRSTNLAPWKADVFRVFANIRTDLVTDQHFADASTTVKWCGDLEAKCKVLRELIVGQMAPVKEQLQMLDDIDKESSRVRILLEKVIKAEKDNRRGQILNEGKRRLADHIETLNQGLGGEYMPHVAADFAEAMKGLRTIETLTAARDTELLRAQTAASEAAKMVKANLALLDSQPREYAALFPDRRALVQKAGDDCAATIAARIADHKAALQKKKEDEEAAAKATADRAEQQRQGELQRQQASLQHLKEKDQAAPLARACAHTTLRNGYCIACGEDRTPEQRRTAPTAETRVAGAGGWPTRPSDERILQAVIDTFQVTRPIALAWLRQVNLDALEHGPLELTQ